MTKDEMIKKMSQEAFDFIHEDIEFNTVWRLVPFNKKNGDSFLDDQRVSVFLNIGYCGERIFVLLSDKGFSGRFPADDMKAYEEYMEPIRLEIENKTGLVCVHA